MLLIAVFLTVFALFVLVVLATGGHSTSKETVRATLESALLNSSRPAGEEIVDVRKNLKFSSIPWMNKLLARVRPAAELRRILTQADLAWTPGFVVLIGVLVWLAALYAIKLKT